jgi:uncharacterized SAM-binding protein YcdF (DUF218 family)
MFVLAKLFELCADPSFWVPVLLVVGAALLWTRWCRLGRILLAATAVFVAVISIVPVGMLLNEVLEDRFPTVRELPAHVDGIIVLGGAVDQVATRFRGQPQLNDAAERMTAFVALARRHPEARLVFTGGSGSIYHPEIKETLVARRFFAEMGLPLDRIVFEDRSRNTWENALYSYRLVKPKPDEIWVLVTSAQHMPRSVGAFRRVGWTPLPYPVDYRTYGWAQYHPGIRMDVNFESLWLALHEWIGLAVYRALDRSSALFPAPAPLPAGTVVQHF